MDFTHIRFQLCFFFCVHSDSGWLLVLVLYNVQPLIISASDVPTTLWGLCHFQHNYMFLVWFGWFFILNTVRATLHLPFIQIFQNVMLKNQTNKLHVLHKLTHFYVTHFFVFIFVHPAVKKNIKIKNKKKVSVWKVLENFLMSFHFVSVFLTAWVKGVCIYGSSFFSFLLLIKKNGHSCTPSEESNMTMMVFFNFIFWNFSQAKIFWSRFEKVSKSIRLSPITRLFTVLIPQYYST